MTMFKPRKAFTLLDLIVLLVLVPVLIIGFTCTPVGRSRETANRVKCANNLHAIGQAILMYANENRGAYPRTIATNGATVTPVWGTGVESSNPFKTGGVEPNDVSAAIFLLLRTQDATAEVFNCPSSDTEKDTYGGKSPTDRSNFGDIKQHLSYSYQNPYPNKAAINRGFELALNRTPPIDAGFAIASDINPGTTGANDNVLAVTTSSSADELKQANSNNHDEDGQNVLYGDGHVEFQQNPFVGVQRDNIFTARITEKPDPKTERIVTSPYDANDSILLPTDE